METTKLIQRLTAPKEKDIGISNPFAFGAGGGRLQPKAMELLAPVFRFDYMGAAEYEFGAVPESLNKIWNLADSNNLFLSTLDIKLKDVKFDRSVLNDAPRTWESCPVYIIGAKNDQEEIERRVRLVATDEDRCSAEMWKRFKGKLHEGLYVRDHVGLDRYIKLEPTDPRPVVGWLELENGFFFSVDRIMTEKFAKLFGMPVEIHLKNPTL